MSVRVLALGIGIACSQGSPIYRGHRAAGRRYLAALTEKLPEEIRAISRFGIGMVKSGSPSRTGPKVAALAQKNIDTNCVWCRVASGSANHSRAGTGEHGLDLRSNV